LQQATRQSWSDRSAMRALRPADKFDEIVRNNRGLSPIYRHSREARETLSDAPRLLRRCRFSQ
jgi:hypothetical protein